MRLWARGDLRIPDPDEPEPEVFLDDAFKAFKLVPEGDLDVEEAYALWPENIRAFNLWLSVQTQWHTDSGYRTGLDYQGVEICIRNFGIPRKLRSEYFLTLQALERAALDEWDKKR